MRQARFGEAGRGANHGEAAVALIAIEGVVVVLKVGDQQVAIAIAIVVPIRDAHASLCAPLGTEGGSGLHADVAELAVAFVPIEKVGCRVIGHIEIWISVVVVVAKKGAQAVGRRELAGLGLAGDVAELAIALVPVEDILRPGEAEWSGEHEDSLPHAASGRNALGRKL